MAERVTATTCIDPIDLPVETEIAVKIRNVDVSHRLTSKCLKVLTNFHLTVPKSCVYGLLGPSGCGKTSLLRCILGRLKVDKGIVLVFGHTPGTKGSGVPGPLVGYMPQDITLYVTMTIAEMLRYFGTIFALSNDDIKERTSYFVELLRLPPKDTLIGNLSGGQMRRVSFATALIHDPKLLILDEPTVGVDPITKQGMWTHLVNLAKYKGTSIILTTHYIEEARQADVVGMIDQGRMVAEDSTAALLSKYNETTLEDVFLKLCCQQYPEMWANNRDVSSADEPIVTDLVTSVPGAGKNKCFGAPVNDITARRCLLDNNQNGICNELNQLSGKLPWYRDFLDECRVSWRRLKAVTVRTVINLYRFPGAILLLLMLPFSQVFLFTQSIGLPIGGLHLGVVNEDLGNLGLEFLSCLDPDMIVLKSYANLSHGLRGAQDGETFGYIHIKPNFSAVIHNRFADMSMASKEMIDSSTIKFHVDNTNYQITKYAELHVIDSYRHFTWDLLKNAGLNPALVYHPINVSRYEMDALTKPTSVYIISGEMITASFLSAVPITVLGIFMERYHGHIEINFIAGVTSAEMMLGLVIVQLALLLVQNLGIILAALPVTYMSKGSLFLIYCMTYATGMNGTVMGIFISLLCKDMIILFGAISGYIFMSAAMAGMFWPLESYPVVAQYFCWALPLAWPTRAIDFIIHRGWSLYNLDVICGFGITFMWLFIHALLSLILLHFKK